MSKERVIRVYFNATDNVPDAAIIAKSSGKAGLRLTANEARHMAVKMLTLADELAPDGARPDARAVAAEALRDISQLTDVNADEAPEMARRALAALEQAHGD